MAPLISSQRSSERLREERGAELIEMALVLPILMLVIAAIIDFGFLFREFNVVTNAAREGARTAILPDYGDADVRQRVQTYLRDAGVGTAITCNSADCVVEIGQDPIPLPSGNIEARAVNVTIYHRFSVLDPISRLVGGSFSSISVSGRSVMRLE